MKKRKGFFKWLWDKLTDHDYHITAKDLEKIDSIPFRKNVKRKKR